MGKALSPSGKTVSPPGKHHFSKEALKAQLQQTTQELDDKLAQMTTVASRLRASLIGKYGAKNEKLEEFGINVHR